MGTVSARFIWNGPRDNRLIVLADPSPAAWEPHNVDDSLFILYSVDADERVTGVIAGIEMLDFLDYRDWGHIPRTETLWQIAGDEPLPLIDLLKRQQAKLRAQYTVARPA